MRKLLSAAATAVALLCAPALAQETPPPDAPPRDAPPAPDEAGGEATPPAEGQAAPAVPAPELPRNVLSTAPTNLLVGVYSLEYERVLTPTLAVYFSPAYLNNTETAPASGGSVTTHTTGYRGNLGARLYTEEKAPSGFFLAAQISYESSTGQATFVDASGGSAPSGNVQTFVYGAGAMLGYDILVGNRVQISLGFLATLQQRRTLISAVNGTPVSDDSAGAFTPAGRVNVGFAF